jgi:hypothetical protein
LWSLASEEQWNGATRSPETVKTRGWAAKQFDN